MRRLKWAGIYLLGIIMLLGLLPLGSNTTAAETTQQNKAVYKDVVAADQALPYVKYLAGKGIINGYPDGTYHPNSGLTRAEAAVIICKAANLTLDTAASSFKDVSDKYWAKAYISAAAKAGYLKGNPDKTFRPEQKLTRAEGISLIFRLSKSDISQAALPTLNDINDKHWAAKPVAAALEAGMAGLSTDGKRFMPDAPFTRANLAQALGILFTQDPSLYKALLPGTLTPLAGTVSLIKNSSDKGTIVTQATVIGAGDTITSVKGAKAEISYPDGSSLLIKDDTLIIVKAAEGRRYIKTDGSEGIAIDWLNVDLKRGLLLGALASRHDGSETAKGTTGYDPVHMIAALASTNQDYNLLGTMATATPKAQPWYATAQAKKVKVEVDMPWGVAAVRGTFWQNFVSSTGQSSSACLTGSMEITAGGQTVSLTQNQANQLTSQAAPPPPPTPMSQQQVQQFAQEQQWVQQTAQIMDQQQEAVAPPPPPPAPVEQPNPVVTPTTPITTNTTQSIISAALQQVGISSGSNTPTATTSGSSGSNNNYSSACDVTAVTVPSNAVISGTAITANAANNTTSLTVYVTVSSGATWKLYSDSGCSAEITDKAMPLAVGANTAYIKITAQDGSTTKVYALVINRSDDISDTDAATPSSIILAAGSSNPAGGVTNVAIPAAGGTDTTGAVTGWMSGTADTIKFTVTDAGAAQSTITINGVAYTSGADYKITSPDTLNIVVTTTESGRKMCTRTFCIMVDNAAGNQLVQISAGYFHALALKNDGTVVAWGSGTNGQTNVPDGLNGVVAVSAGGYHSLALKNDGTVAAWGWNNYGQTDVPAGLSGVIAISAGGYHSLALKNDGTIVAWGRNEFAEINVPPGLNNVVAIDAGIDHSLAIKSDGTIVAWGSNINGELAVPGGLNNVAAVAGGLCHSLVLKGDGTVVAWGAGTINTGSTLNHGQSMVPAGLNNVAAISAGGLHSLALKGDGTVVAWGAGTSIITGDGIQCGQSIIPAGLTNIKAITAGGYFSLALKNDGTVAAWGDNTYGQLNTPAPTLSLTTNYSSPVPGSVLGTTKITSLNLMGIKDATKWQYRVGSSEFAIPALNNINNLAGNYTSGTNITITAGQHLLLLATDDIGRVKAYIDLTISVDQICSNMVGINYVGERSVASGLTLSNISVITNPVDALISAVSSDPEVAAVGVSDHVLSITGVKSGSSNITVTAAKDGYGSNTTTFRVTVDPVTTGLNHSLALRSGGNVMAWGFNDWGQVGDGSITNRSLPVSVNGLSGVVAVTGGERHSLVLKNDGSVWSWGRNDNYQLGDGTTVEKHTPVQVNSISGAAAIASGWYHNLILKSNGEVWAWGKNNFGQVGNGTTTDCNSPVLVSGLTGVVSIASGWYHSLALTNDGCVYTWGDNDFGQLGDNTTVSRYSPQYVNNLSGIIAVAGGVGHSLVLKNDGTVWAWGHNNLGQLGNTTATDSAIPVQVNGLSGIVAIAAGRDHSLALKNDGTVWAWGDNQLGQLGNHTNVAQYSPVQVNSLSGIADITAGEYHNLALKNDGTVWAWGYNGYGQLGIGFTGYQDVPVLTGITIGETAAPAAGDITVIDNPSGDDSVSLANVPANSVVKVYDAATDGTVIGTVTQGGTSGTATVTISGGFNSDLTDIYVTMTETAKGESTRTNKLIKTAFPMSMNELTAGTLGAKEESRLTIGGTTKTGQLEVNQITVPGTITSNGVIVITLNDGTTSVNQNVYDAVWTDTKESIAGHIAGAVVNNPNLVPYYTVNVSGATVIFTAKEVWLDKNVQIELVANPSIGFAGSVGEQVTPGGAGKITVTVNDAVINSTILIPLPGSTTPTDLATMVAQAVNSNSTIHDRYTASGLDNEVVLTSNTVGNNQNVVFSLIDSDNTGTGNVTGIHTVNGEAAAVEVNKLIVSQGSSNSGNLNLSFDDGINHIIKSITLTSGETSEQIASAIKSAYDGFLPDYMITVNSPNNNELLFTRNTPGQDRAVTFNTQFVLN
ncbi:MAG: S-layer homology domain-containing protein [Methylocystaceae bacterium]